MYPLNSGVLLSLYFVLCTIFSETVNGKGRNSNRELWNKENKINSAYRNNKEIFIDEKPEDGMTGSGYGPNMNSWNTDDEDAFSSGYGIHEEEESGSGYMIHAQNCLLLRNQIIGKGMTGVYLPECTKDGNFKSKQCHKDTKFCWCVDKQGREREHTRNRDQALVNCDPPVVVPPKHRNKANYAKKDEEIDIPPINVNDDNRDGIIIENTDEEEDISNHINQMESTNGNVDIKPAFNPEQNTFEEMKSQSNPASITSPAMLEPGMLAVIIGGTVVGLLCAVLLVMFIVYRMRKKDEGSYALEEPKRSPSLHMYSRAPTKEFYA